MEIFSDIPKLFMSDKIFFTIIIAFLILFVITLGFFIYFSNKNKEEKNDINTKELLVENDEESDFENVQKN